MDQNRLHEVIHSLVSRAVSGIAHEEEQRSEADLVKRIVKYVYKAASDPELLRLPWEKICSEVVQRAMHGYSHANGEAPWFFTIDLPPVFCAVVWELLVATGQSHSVTPEQLQDAVILEYEDKLDRKLLDKAMWEAASRTFSDEKVQSKIFQALSRSYWPALDDALVPYLMQEEMHGQLSEVQETKHAEAFTKRWITDTMNRAWVAVEQAEAVLTEDIIVELFFQLITPFGEEDPFTCIPGALTEKIGRPPSDWPFVAQAVEELLAQWVNGGGGGSSRKRRKGAGGGADAAGDDAEGAEDWVPNEPSAKKRAAKARAIKFKGFVGKAEDDDELQEQEGDANEAEEVQEEKGGGHPKCTSEEDCIGNPDCQLIQHVLNGEPGDIYCEPCWNSFYKRNPTLEGVWISE